MPNPLEYIVSNALIYCTEGTAIDQFQPTSNTHYRIQGIVGVESDLELGVNLPEDFAFCEAKGRKKCVPNISGKWQDTYSPLKGEHKNTLIFRCSLKCTEGGTIKFSTSGQKGGGKLDKWDKLPSIPKMSDLNNRSVVVPTYNEEESMKNYEDSIRQQRNTGIQSDNFVNGYYNFKDGINGFIAGCISRVDFTIQLPDDKTGEYVPVYESNIKAEDVKSVLEFGEGFIPIYDKFDTSMSLHNNLRSGNNQGVIIDIAGFLPLGNLAKGTSYEKIGDIGYSVALEDAQNKSNDIAFNNLSTDQQTEVKKLIDSGELSANSLNDSINTFQRNDYGSKGACKAMAEIFGAQSDAAKGKKVLACFPAGTLISTEKGHKVIEDIKPGDLVWAKNEHTKEIALKKVIKIFTRETDILIELILEDEKIKTTVNHPFYTKEGWKEANQLIVNDSLLSMDNKWHQIKNKQFLYSNEKVYNFEVEEFHTYFVGEEKFLVHNACEKPVEGPLPAK